MSIPELIAATGLSQRAFAEYLGIPRRTVENWCMGVSKCPDYILSLIEYKLSHEDMLNEPPSEGEYPSIKSRVRIID